MFCSKCGKSLAANAAQCPNCGMPVGDSRFEGSPYTSVQSRIRPGSRATAAVIQAYTRTNYTSMGDISERGDADVRTTYRPVYEGASAPEDIRREMRAFNEPAEPQEPALPENLSEEAQATLETVHSELKMDNVDLSQFHARPIRSEGRAGISRDVSEYVQRLEEGKQKKGTKRRRSTYDDFADAGNEYVDGNLSISNDQPEVFDDIDEDEFEELRNDSFGLKQILKIAIALVVIAGIFVGGVVWFRYIRGNVSAAPIEGVTEALYTEGLALVKSHADDEYATEMLNTYHNDGILALTTKLEAAKQQYDALKPAEPAGNDELFLSTLKMIEDNISNSITMDALALAQPSDTSVADSTARWAIVDQSIAQLESARSAAELTAILNGEQINVTSNEPTPSPTPAAEIYNKLSKGDKSDEVLTLQNRLYELGYLLSDRDGAFGAKTQTAVKLFQSAVGLEPTGIADNATQIALYAEDAPRTQYAQPTGTTPAATPTQQPQPSNAPDSGNVPNDGEAAA